MKALLDVPAPAKLNLFLHVVGRRDDGYHLLQSVFVPIDWADTLHFEVRQDGRIQRHDLGLALPQDDLCLKAARLLQARGAIAWGVDISIDKRLPSGAGMGGGSSDAATTLLALNRLWQLHWPRRALLELALELGADVPFFVGGTPAFVEGIGERLTPITWPTQQMAVVKPPQGLDTREIFSHPDLVRNTDPAILSGFLADAEHPTGLAGLSGAAQVESKLSAWVDQARNDLESVASRLCPEVAQAAQWLEHRLGNSRMTGSGSAVFARETADNARLMATAGQGGFFGDLPAGWVGRLCRSLEQHPLRGWAD